jgi:hypothetical protein
MTAFAGDSELLQGDLRRANIDQAGASRCIYTNGQLSRGLK